MYEYGCLLYFGIIIRKDTDKAINYLMLSAENGYIDSKALCGRLLIQQKEQTFKEDIDWALKHLHEAAEQDHPLALDTLSELYLDGTFVKKDIEKSIKYLFSSAESGFPLATLKASKLLYNNKQYEHSKHFLLQAVRQEVVDSYLFYAQLLKEGKIFDKNTNLSKEYYLKYLQHKNDPLVMYEFSHFIMSSYKNNIDDLLKAAHFICESYLHNDTPSYLKRRIEKLSPKIVDELFKNFNKSPRHPKDDDIFANLIKFDRNKYPKIKREKIGDYISKIASDHRFRREALADICKPKKSNSAVCKKDKIGRNDPCTCGSNKKFKHCCGN